MADNKTSLIAKQKEKPKDKSFWWVVVVVNITQISYGATLSMGKEAMHTYGVGVIEFSFVRFTTIWIVSTIML
jgi:hypothetical protein